MASADEDQDISGRRTRSGRKISTQHALGSTPRTTRRSSRKHVEEQLAENDAPDIIPGDDPNVYCFEEAAEQHITGHNSAGIQQSDIIRKMVAVTTQDVISDAGPDYFNESTVEQVIEEQLQDECVFYEEVHLHEEDQQQQIEEDVEMYTLPEDEHNDTTEVPIASVSETGVDEKSSSFPFGTVGQSETSEDVHNEEEEEEEASEEINETGAVESSLMASLAGDNANSLPSVGGGEESESNKKEDFEAKAVEPIQPNCESLDSDDSLSNPAIAEDILGDAGGADASDATIVNMEMVSEDELPLPVKPEINDAEEVSDDELPAPQRAELPADAEVISEDELPAANANDKKSPDSSPNRDKRANSADATAADGGGFGAGQKRKADENKVQQVVSETKKKSNNEQYNPMSPTSESNDGLPPPPEKKAKIDGTDIEQKEKKRDKEKEKEKDRKRLPDLDKYWRAVKDDPADFTGWTYLLQYVDNETDAEAAREAYDAFLEHYPYCYGYWRKYADFEKRKGIKSNCNAVFERGLEAIPLSVDLWIHYLTHVKSTHGDNEDYIRSQFERAISACGLEFRSDKLWDAYVKWENDGKRYKRVFSIYNRLLTIPTQGYSGHFDNFQDLFNQHSIISTISSDELVKIRLELHELTTSRPSAALRSSKSRRESNSKERELHDEKKDDELTDKSHGSGATGGTIEAPGGAASDAVKLNKLLEINDLSTLTDEEILSIKDKVISVRRKWHKSTVAAVTARWTFEEAIKRPYFHVKPLERSQLKNWKDYLDFEIEMGDRKRILVLFERCLIACALYDEFWLKMIRYLETQLVGMEAHPGSKIAAITSDVFRRACEIHHPDKPSLHLMWSAFEECMGKFDRAAEILVKLEQKCPNILQVAYRRINVERRRGDLTKCRELYEHYINVAKNKTIAGSLAIKYARFLNKQCHDLDGGLRVLRQALDRDGANTRVALQMIDLALQRPKVDEEEVVKIMDRFMARESIDPEQKVLFAQRKVEFLEDFGSTARGLQDAQRSLQLALGKANEAKKKRESSPNRKTVGAKDSGAMSGPSAQSNYNNGGSATANSYYNSGNSPYAAYGQTTSGAYQQQQQPYDGYYNHWQYGSTGYSGYNQWSGYGNYY